MKFNIEKEFKNCGGIYAIRNNVNSKIYIGSAVNLRKRYEDHAKRVRNNYHKNQILQNFANKYGVESLEFVLLELVSDRNSLIKKEQWYLDFYQPFDDRGFNICRIAASSLGVKRRPETIEKLKLSLMKRTPPRTGIKSTPEFNLKMSQFHRKSEDGYKIEKVRQYDMDGKFIKEYDCPYSASLELNLSSEKISEVCAGKRRSHKNFQWKYSDGDNPTDITPYADNNNGKRVQQVDSNGFVLREFPTCSAAGKFMGTSGDLISQSCRSGGKSSGFFWKYPEV